MNQGGFESAPFIRSDDKGDRVQLPGTFHAAGITVYIEGNALLMYQPPGIFPASFQFARSDVLERLQEIGIVRTPPVLNRQAFVKQARLAPVVGQNGQTGRGGRLINGTLGFLGVNRWSAGRAGCILIGFRHCANRG